jgi:hypothetical protein
MAMMAKRFSNLPSNRLVAAAMAAQICLLISGPISAGEQIPDSADSQRLSANSNGVPAAGVGLDDTFEARWMSVGKEFSIGADGKARAAATSPQDAPIDNLLALSQQSSPVSGNSQIDIIRKSVDQECGPSPMSASEIGRLVAAAAEEHGVDPDFALAIAAAESRLDRHRNSPKGARGPMQLMPATAERFGVDDICDPVSNIDGGVRYLRELFDTLGNPLLVAAAYNAGETRVREHGGIPPFPETLGFVAEVINRRLGLPTKNTQASASSSDTASAPEILDTPAGVITTTERRRWVGGVMHF